MENKENEKSLIKDYCVGIIVGIISGFFGTGGGLILVPYFSKKLNNDEQKTRATTVFCVLFMVITSGLFYIKNINIDFVISMKCIIGGIIGSFIGSKLLVCLNENFLNTIFIVFLLYTGIKMIIG